MQSYDQWIDWKKRIQHSLLQFGLHRLLRDEKGPPVGDQKQLEEWEDRQDQAVAILKCRRGVMAEEIIGEETNVAEAFRKLEEGLKPTGTDVDTLFIEKITGYNRLSLGNCRNVANFV